MLPLNVSSHLVKVRIIDEEDWEEKEVKWPRKKAGRTEQTVAGEELQGWEEGEERLQEEKQKTEE